MRSPAQLLPEMRMASQWGESSLSISVDYPRALIEGTAKVIYINCATSELTPSGEKLYLEERHFLDLAAAGLHRRDQQRL
jgi:hypothetical protein